MQIPRAHVAGDFPFRNGYKRAEFVAFQHTALPHTFLTRYNWSIMEKKSVYVLLLAILVGGVFLSAAIKVVQKQEALSPKRNFTNTMRVISKAFPPGELIPPRYTCDGKNISPEMRIFEVPESAKSIALIVDDPDAPAGTWVHWLVWNMSPATKIIPEGSVPEGAVEGITSFGAAGYGGPCPPSGTHRYFFKLYALDTVFELDPKKTRVGELEYAMERHIISKAETIGTYRRN